jgi:hypothetical protein
MTKEENAQAMHEQYASLSKEELIAKLQKVTGGGPVKFKIGGKGGVSVSGLGQRFPTTLYADSWLKLLEHADELKKFIQDNKDDLAEKK